MNPHTLAAAALLSLAVAACGGSDVAQENAGNEGDAGLALPPTVDAGGAVDAGLDASFDAGSPVLDAAAPRDAAITRDASTSDAAATANALCLGASTASFEAPTTCDAVSGNTTTTRPANSVYATSWFGCYRNAAGTLVTDPSDNCVFACGNRGLCATGLSGPECQAQLQWFSADADRFGCGARIKVTNCVNGRAVVLAALDRGPNCRSVEQAFGAPVIDMSWPAMTYLFDGRTYGASDKKRVVVEVVGANATLGPVR
jgi:hypothetical protein